MFRFVVIIIVFLAGLAFAQQGPPGIYNSEKEKGSPMPAAEAAAKFKVPPGFRVSVFAAEPDVNNPIACCWDPKGRLWVAENYTYAERPMNFDLNLHDRILIFTDKGEGKIPDRKVFCDNLQCLTSIEVGLGGVWAMCPPQLLFIPMKDDKPAGPPEVVIDGFTVSPENYHNFANGLKWGPDGWLYGRCGASCPGKLGPPGTPMDQRILIHGGIWRYHPKRKVVEVLCHGTTNPWGHDWDERGECFFINTVNGHLWHMIPGAHYTRPHTIDPNPYVYKLIDQHADHYHWDNSKPWEDSRNVNNAEHDKRGGGHAHCGAMIYLGTQWPKEYYGKLFTINLHGRRVNVDRLERHGSGFVGKHEPDMLNAADPFFRGTEITYGPDGSVYILDWSDTGECHENTGVHRTSGRIYRVMCKSNRSHVSSEGSQFQREVLGRRTFPLRTIDAVWAEEWCLVCRDMRTTQLMKDENESMRTQALRLLVDHLPLDTCAGPLPHFSYYFEDWEYQRIIDAARFEKSALVRLALASTLQRLPVAKRRQVATELVAHKEYTNDHNLPLLVWYGLIPVAKDHPDHLVKVATTCEWPITRQCIARRLAEDIEKRPGPLNDLLNVTLGKPDAFTSDILLGISEGLRGCQRAAKPQAWEAVASKFAHLPLVRDLSVVFGDGRALDEVRQLALNIKEPLESRRAALKTLISARPTDLRAVCESLLKTQFLNTTAVQGLVLSDDPAIGSLIVDNYKRFHISERPNVIDACVSRPALARAVLVAIESKKIPKTDLTANHARAIASHKDAQLNERLTCVWGNVKPSPAEKQAAIAQWKGKLTSTHLAKADLSNGRLVFQNTCVTCHRLYGTGGEIGPDLTGAGRDNLDYLLENILDPSAVVSADFRVTAVALNDGRLLLGIVKTRTNSAITLQMEKELVTIRRADIETETRSDQSIMADGLLKTLSDSQVRDLFAYLMHRGQVGLPPNPLK